MLPVNLSPANSRESLVMNVGKLVLGSCELLISTLGQTSSLNPAIV